ncbi:hypothetical protein CBOM_03153 [Ceraceosorus bombacis]|uniref:Zn(2)-C6 fungal-type domain-containing protein n=1 Tax=Ceraceosorus bombacis TaxID=401625 RepID=A0A0N7LAN5_9BASI|nr:hypothetical protein CBOM_03153 [Ceraceosorus bombacis]
MYAPGPSSAGMTYSMPRASHAPVAHTDERSHATAMWDDSSSGSKRSAATPLAAASPTSPPKMTTACTRCSNLKVKCDGQQPCAKCITAEKSDDCEYRAAKKRGPPKGCPARGGIKKRSFLEGVTQQDEPSAPPRKTRGSSETTRKRGTKLAGSEGDQVDDEAYKAARGLRDLHGQTSPSSSTTYSTAHSTHSAGPAYASVLAASEADAGHGLLALGVAAAQAAESNNQRSGGFGQLQPGFPEQWPAIGAKHGSPPFAQPDINPQRRTEAAEHMGLSRSGLEAWQTTSAQRASSPITSSAPRLIADPTAASAVTRGDGSIFPDLRPFASRQSSYGFSHARTPSAGSHQPAFLPGATQGQGAPTNGWHVSNPQTGPTPATSQYSNEQAVSGALPFASDAAKLSGDHYLATLDDRVENSLCQYFLAFHHSLWPMFYAPTITSLKELRKREPNLWKAVIGGAAATADVESGPPRSGKPPVGFTELSETLISDAKASILANELGSRPRIATCQALILITLCELGHGRMSSAWNLGGLACRVALDLRLHLEDDRPLLASTEALSESRPSSWLKAVVPQERRRTFWACYALDKMLCAVLEKPVMLRAADSSQPLPSASERDETDVWLSSESAKYAETFARNGLQGVRTHSLSNFVAWVETLQALETVMQEVYSLRARSDRCAPACSSNASEASSGADASAALKRNKQVLVSWTHNLPRHLLWASPTARAIGGMDATQVPGFNPPPVVTPHLLTVRGWFCTTVLLLHRPWIMSDSGISSDVKGGDPAGTGTWCGRQATRACAKQVCLVAATELLELFACYERWFRSRKVPSSWPYLLFSAATVFAPLAGFGRKAVKDRSSQDGLDVASEKYEACMAMLERLSQVWESARHLASVLKSIRRSSALDKAVEDPGLNEQLQAVVDKTAGAVAAHPGHGAGVVPMTLGAYMSRQAQRNTQDGGSPKEEDTSGDGDVSSAIRPWTSHGGPVSMTQNGQMNNQHSAYKDEDSANMFAGPDAVDANVEAGHHGDQPLIGSAMESMDNIAGASQLSSDMVNTGVNLSSGIWNMMPLGMPVAGTDHVWDTFLDTLAR